MPSSKSIIVQSLVSSLLVSISLSAPTPENAVLAARAACPQGGQSYTVKPMDMVNALAIQFSTSTDDFLAVNCLNPKGSDLIAGATICVPPPCNVYLVASGDTCEAIAKAHNLTTDQFYDHNPGINSPDCSNLIAGQNVCLDRPHGSQFPAPVCTSSSANSTTTATAATGSAISAPAASAPAASAPAASASAGGNPSGMSPGCKKTYTAVTGDYCIKIAAHGSIDLLALQKLNPGIIDPTNTCPNIVVGAQYCIAGPGPYGGSIGTFTR